MPKISLNQVKELREATGAGIMEAKKALEEANGDQTKAKQILAKQGLEKAAKRQDKATGEGQVFAYVHHGGRVAAIVKVLCETDFVARSGEFQVLGKELAMQVASMEPKDVQELLQQAYIRDGSKTIDELVKETGARVKENIVVAEIARISL